MVKRPANPPPESESADPVDADDPGSYGVEYVILAVALVVGVFLLSPRAQGLLSFLYAPQVILLVLVIFAEYIILKARDRSYALEREIEHQRERRRVQQAMLDELEAVLRQARLHLEEAPTGEERSLHDRLQAVRAELDETIDRLERRV